MSDLGGTYRETSLSSKRAISRRNIDSPALARKRELRTAG